MNSCRQAGRQTRETMNTKSTNRQESPSKSIYCRRKCLKQPSLRRPLASHNSCRQAGKLTDRQEKQLTRKACIERNHSQNKSTESILNNQVSQDLLYHMNSCRQPGRHPTRNCNKLSFLVFLENIPVYSEARLNKRVNCVLLGVGGAWCIIAFKSMRCPGGHPVPLWWVQSLRSRRELE